MRVHGKEFSQFKHNWFLNFDSFQIFLAFERFQILQCYHHVFIVFHCLGCWNEIASDWHQLFKTFSKEFLFFCYFEKMSDFKHAFGTSSWIKNSGNIANIWKFENAAIGSI